MPTHPETYKPPKTGAKRYRTTTAQQTDARQIRSTARWQRLRALKVSRDPLCEHPECKRPTPVDEVHHIRSVEKHPELAYVLDNLASLCKSHHGKVTAQEIKGIDTTRLFDK